jgi:hypothetical protein
MALGSKKDKGLTKQEIIDKAVELDLRRQAQIARQSNIISRLVTENQMMMGLLGEIAQGTSDGSPAEAREILDEIQRLRDAQRKEDKKTEQP